MKPKIRVRKDGEEGCPPSSAVVLIAPLTGVRLRGSGWKLQQEGLAQGCKLEVIPQSGVGIRTGTMPLDELLNCLNLQANNSRYLLG